MNQRERALQIKIKRTITLSSDRFQAFIVDNNPTPLRDRNGKVTGIKKSHADTGMGDILVQGPRCLAFELEVKVGRGKQSDSQRQHQAEWEAHGGKYYLVRSVQQALMACLDFAGAHGIVDHRLEKTLEQLAA